MNYKILTMLIDSHTHLNSFEFEEDVDDIITKNLNKGIWQVNIGTDLQTSKQAISIAEKYEEGVYATVAVHPDYVTRDNNSFDITKLKELAKSSPKVVAIGETGFDLYRLEGRDKNEVLKYQEKAFRESIKLAKELNLAVVVHGRGESEDPYFVYDEILRILKDEKVQRAVIHSFGGNVTQALKFTHEGYFIGITGIVSFKKPNIMHEVAKIVPLENILIETDAPYLTPEPYRGKRNEPAYVEFVAKRIAELKGIEYAKVAQETAVNARRFYVI